MHCQQETGAQAAEELAEAQRVMMTPEAVSHSRHLHAVGASLRAFDIVRGLFGPSGPCVLPRTQVGLKRSTHAQSIPPTLLLLNFLQGVHQTSYLMGLHQRTT